MEEKEILDLIKTKLTNINYDYSILTPSQIKQLIKIETEVSKRISMQKDYLNNLKDIKINISSISNTVGIARKTIYNNDILKEYIEYSSELYENNFPNSDTSTLKEKLSEYKNIIDEMVKRDILLEDLKNEIDILQKELLLYKEKNDDLALRNNELYGKILSYENKQKKKSSFEVIK